jgi:hypothetical protein
MRQTYFRWFLEKPMSNSGLVRPEIFLIFSGFERATPTVTPARWQPYKNPNLYDCIIWIGTEKDT